MPRAFLVKKRGPKRASGTSPNSLSVGVDTENLVPDKEVLGPSPSLCLQQVLTPMIIKPERCVSPPDGGKPQIVGIDETDSRMKPWSRYQPLSWDSENKDPRETEGEGSEVRYGKDGASLTPPQGAVPEAYSVQSAMGKTSPDAALEPEKMTNHRSPAVPSSGSLRAIGYITSTRSGTKITIEKTPGEVIHYPSPPPRSPPQCVPSMSRSPPRLSFSPRSRSPLRSRSPPIPRSPPRSRSPRFPPAYASTRNPYRRTGIWAPHREFESMNYDQIYGSGTFEEKFYGERSYRPFPSPPSYHSMLSFSPDLPSQQDRNRYSPVGQYKMRDIKQEPILPPEPIVPQESPQSVGYSFDHGLQVNTKQPYMDASRMPEGMMPMAPRGSPNASESRLIMPPVDSPTAPLNCFPRDSPPPIQSFLTERLSPSNAPRNQKLAESQAPDYQKGQYDRYHAMAPGYGNRNTHYNVSAIKDCNGSKSWKDGEGVGERIKPKIPWGIENVPVDMVDYRAIAPKKSRENDPPRFQCDACKKSYATHGGLSKHKQFHCTATIKKEFSCKYCPKTYVSLGALKMHIRTHTLPCKCHLCGKAFSRPWLLQGHVRTHTGEKPFQCSHCGRSFADRSNLRAHLQTHTDIKKYNCRNCSKSFSRNSLLLKHEDGGCINAI